MPLRLVVLLNLFDWGYNILSFFIIRESCFNRRTIRTVYRFSYYNSKNSSCCKQVLNFLYFKLRQVAFQHYFYLGIPFVITNYRKGVFFAISRDRSGAVRQVQQPSRSQKIIKKYALFGAKHFCGWETDRIAARLGKANARSCTCRTTSGV